jgi:hypothetical protein
MSFPHNSAACPCAPCESRRQAEALLQRIRSFEQGYYFGATEAQNAAQYTLAQFEAEIYMLRTHIQALGMYPTGKNRELSSALDLEL